MPKQETNHTELLEEEIEIPEVSYEGEDSKLLELVGKFKKGTLRIIIFTLVGAAMGWFSYTYTTDSFFITKVIFAVPYKISEAIYVSVIGTGAVPWYPGADMWGFTEFFPQSVPATFLAERVTPILIGTALYGCMGYFTGDKRVFTLRRFVKFLFCHGVVLAVFIAVVYGVNAKAEYDNNRLRGTEYFSLESETQGETITGDRAEILLNAFENGRKEDDNIIRNEDGEIRIHISFAGGMRNMSASVNAEERYLATEDGSTFRISEEFCGYVKEYYDTGGLMGVQTIEVEEGESADESISDQD